MSGGSASRAAGGWSPCEARTVQAWAVERGALVIVGLLFAALLVGERPFAAGAVDKAAVSESGSAFNRLVIFAGFACALPMGAVVAGRVAGLLGRTWPVWLLALWLGATVLWASHPDLVQRRILALLLVYATLLVAAAAAPRAEDLLWPLVAVFATLVLLSSFAWIALPAVSWSEIGETGIFDNKNTAGSMAMLAIVLLNGAVLIGRRPMARLTLLALLLLAWAFLVATRSKTSLGVAAVMTVACPVLYLAAGARPAVRLALLLAVAGAGLSAAVAYAGAGYDDRDLRLLLFGDLTFTGRTEIWEHVAAEIARRPWLGQGFGSFWDTGGSVNPLRSAPPGAWFMDAQLINTAHNGYLDAWLQTGLIGLALAVLVVTRGLWVLAVEATLHREAERVALLTALCAASCLVLNNFLESYLFRTGDPLGYLFVFLLFHAEAARRRRQRVAA